MATTKTKSAATKVTKAPKAAKTPKAPKVEFLTEITSTTSKGDPVVKKFTKPTGPVAQIINLYIQGKTQKEIVEAGFNKSTVYRQVIEYKKFANIK